MTDPGYDLDKWSTYLSGPAQAVDPVAVPLYQLRAMIRDLRVQAELWKMREVGRKHELRGWCATLDEILIETERRVDEQQQRGSDETE